MAECLKRLDVHLKVLSTKATHSRIPHAITDFPELDPNSRMIQSTAVGNTD